MNSKNRLRDYGRCHCYSGFDWQLILLGQTGSYHRLERPRRPCSYCRLEKMVFPDHFDLTCDRAEPDLGRRSKERVIASGDVVNGEGYRESQQAQI